MLPLLALRYNLATSQLVVYILTNLKNTERESINLKWDLAPSLAEHPSIGHNFINARVEQVAAKPFFRKTFKQQQCLILTDGFFEWKLNGTTKQPYYFRMCEYSTLVCVCRALGTMGERAAND